MCPLPRLSAKTSSNQTSAGRMLKAMGDGLPVEFASFTDAVNAPQSCRRKWQKSNVGRLIAGLELSMLG